MSDHDMMALALAISSVSSFFLGWLWGKGRLWPKRKNGEAE